MSKFFGIQIEVEILTLRNKLKLKDKHQQHFESVEKYQTYFQILFQGQLIMMGIKIEQHHLKYINDKVR